MSDVLTIFLYLFDWLLPLLFTVTDTVTNYYNKLSIKIQLISAISKLTVALFFTIYIGYAYLYKGNMTRAESNKVAFWMYIIILIIMIINTTFTVMNYIKEVKPKPNVEDIEESPN